MPRNPARIYSVAAWLIAYCCSHFWDTSACAFHVLDQPTYSPDRVLREVLNVWSGAKMKTSYSAAIVSLSNTGHWLFKNRETLLKNDVCVSVWPSAIFMSFSQALVLHLKPAYFMPCAQIHTHPHVHPSVHVHSVACFFLSFLTCSCWLFLHPFLLPHVLPFLLTPTHLLARSLTHSLTHSRCHLYWHSHTHSLAHSHACLFTLFVSSHL